MECNYRTPATFISDNFPGNYTKQDGQESKDHLDMIEKRCIFSAELVIEGNPILINRLQEAEKYQEH